MIAVDTNVLIRFFIKEDDKAQHERVIDLFLKKSIYITKTVLLETEWVLRANYQLPRALILNAFKKLLLLKHIYFEAKENIVRAVDYFEEGMDFADAMHLASTPTASGFVSFDKKLIQKAKQVHCNAELL